MLVCGTAMVNVGDGDLTYKEVRNRATFYDKYLICGGAE